MSSILFSATALAADRAPVPDGLYPVPAESRVVQGVEILTYAYIDKAGRIAIPAQFAHAGAFFDGFAAVDFEFPEILPVGGRPPREEKTTYLINRKGERFGPYFAVSGFSEGHTAIYQRRAGSSVTLPRAFEGLFAPDVWATLFDTTLKPVTHGQYLEMGPLSEGLAAAFRQRTDGSWGWCYVDSSERQLIELKDVFRSYPFKSGMARVQTLDRRFGFIDRTGVMKIPPVYREAEDFSEGVAAVRRTDSRYQFIDARGGEAVPGDFEFARSFKESLAVVGLRDAKTGRLSQTYIDKQGTAVLPPSDRALSSFSEGLAVVGIAGKGEEYADRKGHDPFARTFDHATPFSNGLALVEWHVGDHLMRAMIDRQGKEVWKPVPQRAP